jgi:hypothetical protein
MKLNIEDFERESLKDSVYLLEEQMRMEQEFLEHINRKPAIVVIVDKDKILKQNESMSDLLPF